MPTRLLKGAEYPCSCGTDQPCPQLIVREALIPAPAGPHQQGVHLTLSPGIFLRNGLVLNRDQAVHLANLLLGVVQGSPE